MPANLNIVCEIDGRFYISISHWGMIDVTEYLERKKDESRID